MKKMTSMPALLTLLVVASVGFQVLATAQAPPAQTPGPEH